MNTHLIKGSHIVTNGNTTYQQFVYTGLFQNGINAEGRMKNNLQQPV